MSATLIVVGILVLAAGAVVLVVDARRRAARRRARQAWAGHHSARYAEADPVLTGQWRYGVFTRGGSGRARELVSHEHEGSRLYLFDLERGGGVVSTVLALQRPTTSDTVLELRLGSSAASPESAGAESKETGSAETGAAEVGREAGMDLLGPVGDRYAFTNDLESARRAVDQRLVLVGDATGDDVSVLWAEGSWALAALDVNAGPQRWDEVAAILGRFADLMRLLPPVHHE
jgi:hypothetical protein